jgi:hypothetical protein
VFAGHDLPVLRGQGRADPRGADPPFPAHRLQAGDKIDDPAELLVQGIVQGVEEFGNDPYFESFYGPAAAGTTTRIAGGSPAIRAVVVEAMGPLFDLAEATGRLRPHIDRDQATEWIMLITTALLTIPQPSMGTRVEREVFLRTFLVPALFA